MEYDLSLRKQFLDLLIVRKEPGPLPRQLPDGFEELAPHNLITFKSHQESFDGWAAAELIGHYVNYRKQSSPSMQDLLPEADYCLYAVAARFPRNLAREFPLVPVREGVYQLQVPSRSIQVVVASELPETKNNAMLQLFSARLEILRHAQPNYRPVSMETSTLQCEVFKFYNVDREMPNRLQEFVKESIDRLLKSLPAEERLKGLPAEERLKGFPAEERLKGMTAEDVLRGISPEALKVLAQRLNGPTTEDSDC